MRGMRVMFPGGMPAAFQSASAARKGAGTSLQSYIRLGQEARVGRRSSRIFMGTPSVCSTGYKLAFYGFHDLWNGRRHALCERHMRAGRLHFKPPSVRKHTPDDERLQFL